MANAYTAAEMADILHQAASLYMASNLPTDYGTGETYTSVEVHMLKYLADHPGKTVTDLAREWDKTKAAISQMLKKMEEKGLIRRERAAGGKKQLYRPTEKGLRLKAAHTAYDDRVFGQTLELLRRACSEEEIDVCFRVLQAYAQARRQKHYRSPED